MASPCGEESLPIDRNWQHCCICNRQSDECVPIWINKKLYWFCNGWNDVIKCFEIYKGWIEEGHSFHCIKYMATINRKNCVCDIEKKKDRDGQARK